MKWYERFLFDKATNTKVCKVALCIFAGLFGIQMIYWAIML